MTIAAQATRITGDVRVRMIRFNFAPGAETGWH